MASELTPEAIAELRKLPLHAPRPLFYYDPQERLWDALPALLDAAERCAAAEAQAKEAGELLRGLLAACEAKDSLLACYRLGKQPSARG
jgi:hypothetical protein